jgi:isoleucyl-tRNA synthetase
MIKKVTKSLDNYDAYIASGYIESFVDDLSNWYIRRSRERTGSEFYQTLYFVLVSLTKVLAPFTPFLSEIIYKNLTKKDSVHLADWPQPEIDSPLDEKLIVGMERVRRVCELGHAQRKRKGIPVRQPLQSIEVGSPHVEPSGQFLQLIADELNVKKVIWKKKAELIVKLDTKITSALKEEAKTRELIRKIQQERKRMGIKLSQKTKVSTPWLPKSNKLIQRILAKTFTEKLEKGKFSVDTI